MTMKRWHRLSLGEVSQLLLIQIMEVEKLQRELNEIRGKLQAEKEIAERLKICLSDKNTERDEKSRWKR